LYQILSQTYNQLIHHISEEAVTMLCYFNSYFYTNNGFIRFLHYVSFRHLFLMTAVDTKTQKREKHIIHVLYVQVVGFVNNKKYVTQTEHGLHSSQILCCYMYCLFCVVICIVCV
jgi:hypothetical protein